MINAITPASSPGSGVTIIAGKDSTYVDFAALITALINFLLVAAVIYFVIVLPLNTIKERRKRGEEAGPAEPTAVELLAEIPRFATRPATFFSIGGVPRSTAIVVGRPVLQQRVVVRRAVLVDLIPSDFRQHLTEHLVEPSTHIRRQSFGLFVHPHILPR